MLCKIGDVEVWRILEICAPFKTPEELFTNAGEDVRSIIEERDPGSICAATGRLILPIQGFLLKTPSHNILVDSCVGNHKSIPGHQDWNQREGGRFMAALTAAGVATNDIDYVLCTHLHVDHIGWNTRLQDGRWVPTFPNARYLMPSNDEASMTLRGSVSYGESVLPILEAGQAELVEAGHMLGEHVELVPSPGHTPGHVSVLVKGGDRAALITGDALHSTAQCWHPEWHFKYDADPGLAVTSRKEILARCSETGCMVLGSHFSLPSLGYVTSGKNGFRWRG